MVLAADDTHRDSVVAELLSAAQMLRETSGQGHRPWEVRARHGTIDDLASADEQAAVSAGRAHTLASAAALAIRELSADV